MKVKKCKGLTKIVAYLLVGAMVLGGCGAGTGRGDGQGDGQGSVAESSAEQGTNDSQGSTEGSKAESNSDQEGQLPEVTALNANLNAVLTDFAATNENFSGQVIEATNFGLRIGGLLPAIERVEGKQLSKEETAEMNRAMRAYTGSKYEDMIINDAIDYYLYDQLTPELQTFYDALYTLGLDPTTTENVVTFQTDKDPSQQPFWDDYMVALLALNYDHPEMWWMYLWNGSVESGAGWDNPVNGKYTIYLQFMKTYDAAKFEKDLKAFNDAVASFLSDIDQNASEEQQALQVHDKLYKMATYDMSILQENKNNFGHTAFGPFVSNTEGTPHYCVCDGYALAYTYALQQLGIMATVVTGMAGDAGADGGMGGHAWSIILLNDKWYEVDVCWDDSYDDFKETVEQSCTPGSLEYQVYMEMANDQVYMDKLAHFMYRLSTAQINNYKAPQDLVYTTKDGQYRIQMVGDSQRERFCDYKDTKDSGQGKLTALLPIADGKLYTGSSDGDNSGSSDGGSTGGGSSSGDTGNSGGGDTGNSDSSDEGDWGFDLSDLVNDSYAQIAGTYYVSAFNNYSEAVLKQYYGNDYYKQLSMFDLKADGTGTIYENGSSLNFTYYFDGYYLYMFASNGGSLCLGYNNGKFLMYDYYGNVYTFSKM